MGLASNFRNLLFVMLTLAPSLAHAHCRTTDLLRRAFGTSESGLTLGAVPSEDVAKSLTEKFIGAEANSAGSSFFGKISFLEPEFGSHFNLRYEYDFPSKHYRPHLKFSSIFPPARFASNPEMKKTFESSMSSFYEELANSYHLKSNLAPQGAHYHLGTFEIPVEGKNFQEVLKIMKSISAETETRISLIEKKLYEKGAEKFEAKVILEKDRVEPVEDVEFLAQRIRKEEEVQRGAKVPNDALLERLRVKSQAWLIPEMEKQLQKMKVEHVVLPSNGSTNPLIKISSHGTSRLNQFSKTSGVNFVYDPVKNFVTASEMAYNGAANLVRLPHNLFKSTSSESFWHEIRHWVHHDRRLKGINDGFGMETLGHNFQIKNAEADQFLAEMKAIDSELGDRVDFLYHEMYAGSFASSEELDTVVRHFLSNKENMLRISQGALVYDGLKSHFLGAATGLKGVLKSATDKEILSWPTRINGENFIVVPVDGLKSVRVELPFGQSPSKWSASEVRTFVQKEADFIDQILKPLDSPEVGAFYQNGIYPTYLKMAETERMLGEIKPALSEVEHFNFKTNIADYLNGKSETIAIPQSLPREKVLLAQAIIENSVEVRKHYAKEVIPRLKIWAGVKKEINRLSWLHAHTPEPIPFNVASVSAGDPTMVSGAKVIAERISGETFQKELNLYLITNKGELVIAPRLPKDQHLNTHRVLADFIRAKSREGVEIVAAGEFRASGKDLIILNNKSNSYHGDQKNLDFAKEVFSQKGFKMSSDLKTENLAPHP